MPIVIDGIKQLRALVGTEVPVSDWLEITQPRIDQFANALSDQQWIHVDGERAARESPFGATIAHSFLTLSLLSRWLTESLVFSPPRVGVNYGFNRVRFTAPVPVGSRVRARFRLLAVEG